MVAVTGVNGIAVVGSGYVGTVVAACMAAVGHDVVGVEINEEKLAKLQSGSSYFYEPGLDARLRSAIEAGRLSFTNNFEEAMAKSEVVFLCVDTPQGENGHPDVTNVTAAARSIGRAIHSPHVIVTKSTVPVGSGNWLTSTIESVLPDDVEMGVFSVVSNPEFLREGSAVADFLFPERIVLGGDDKLAVEKVVAAYKPDIWIRASPAVPPKPSRRWSPRIGRLPRRSSMRRTHSWRPRSVSSTRSRRSANGSMPTSTRSLMRSGSTPASHRSSSTPASAGVVRASAKT